jgi:hypothetical protein
LFAKTKKTLPKMQTEKFDKPALKNSLKSSQNSSLSKSIPANSAPQAVIPNIKVHYLNDSGLYGGGCSLGSIILF